MFAYCGNNPVSRKDENGEAFETVFDVLSLGASIMEVAFNPADPFAWLGLAGDAIDLIPFVTGVGETIRILKAGSKVTDTADNVIDTYRRLKKASSGTGLEVHHIVEKRFSTLLGFGKTGSGMPSIPLLKDAHLNYTNAWREVLAYGRSYTKKEILEAAIGIYRDDPEMLGAAIYTITKSLL